MKLEFRPIITDNFTGSGVTTQPSSIEQTGYLRRCLVKDFVRDFDFRTISIFVLRPRDSKNFYGGEFNHLEPASGRIDHSHAHKFHGGAGLALDSVGSNKINLYDLPRVNSCNLGRQMAILPLPLLAKLATIAILRELPNFRTHPVPIHRGCQRFFKSI